MPIHRKVERKKRRISRDASDDHRPYLKQGSHQRGGRRTKQEHPKEGPMGLTNSQGKRRNTKPYGRNTKTRQKDNHRISLKEWPTPGQQERSQTNSRYRKPERKEKNSTRHLGTASNSVKGLSTARKIATQCERSQNRTGERNSCGTVRNNTERREKSEKTGKQRESAKKETKAQKTVKQQRNQLNPRDATIDPVQDNWKKIFEKVGIEGRERAHYEQIQQEQLLSWEKIFEEDRQRALHYHKIQQEALVSKIRIQMSMMAAQLTLEISLPNIHRRGRERRTQRHKATRRLQDRITSRDYVGLLYMATMSTLHDQKGRMGAMFLPLTRFDIEEQEGIHRNGGKKTPRMTQKRRRDSSPPPGKPTKTKEPRYALAMHRRVETWTVHGGGPASRGNQLIEKVPWIVPPWGTN